MFLVLIRRRRARLQLHKTATGLQPICNQIRPPYDRHTSVWRSVCAATYLQPHAIRYDRHTTAIQLFGAPYDCNQTATYLQPHATRYDRHTTAIRLFGGLFVLQPICNLMQSGTTAIRLFADPYDCNQIRPPYNCLELHTTATRLQPICNLMQSDTTAIQLFGGLFVLQPICNLMQSGTTAIQLFGAPYDCNQTATYLQPGTGYILYNVYTLYTL